jgi:2'-5' RNA ligase
MPEGLGTPDLECVMLKLAPLEVVDHLGKHASADDLFYGDTPELKYAQGAVGEKKAHVTLLFGIHPSPTYRRKVDAVLKGWKPETVHVTEVSTFPIRDEEQEYYVVKGDVKVTDNLREGRARIEVLDHTDGFPEYHPHVTLAYVKRTANIDMWVQYLDEVYGGKDFEVTGLDYGDDD